jgi:hypothetical protein
MFFYRYILNPVMRGLLRSPIHRLASGNIAILHFKGRHSGRWLNTPLSYMREGDIVRLLSNRKTHWWRNLADSPTQVKLEIQRSHYQGDATLYDDGGELALEGIRRFIAAVPRDAKVYGLELDSHRQLSDASLSAKISELILVEIELK